MPWDDEGGPNGPPSHGTVGARASAGQLAESKRFATSDQLTTFQNASM
jgi:hypothetical protein